MCIFKYNYGDEFILDEPKRDGYIFEGWFEDEELLRNKSNIMKTDEQDFTLYAKWSEAVKETYDVIYHSNDGKTHKKATYSKGEQDLLIPSLRNDFVFDGWYLESDFVTKVENLSGKDVEEVELYAKWVPYEKITEVPENKENTSSSSSSVTSKENKETQSPKEEVKEEKKETKETEKKQDKVVVKETVQGGIPWWTLLIAVFGGALIPIIYIKRKGYNNKI